MTTDVWKTPLEEMSDPFRLRKWAEMVSVAEIPIELMSVASARSFVEGYMALMRSLSHISNFAEAKDADGLASQGLSAFGEPAVNIAVLTKAMNYCRKCACIVKSPEKKEAWGKALCHISSWCSAFSSSARQLLSAVLVDQVLVSEVGAISIEEAEERVRLECGVPLHDIVCWYLQTIREKYRKDITITNTSNAKGVADSRQDGETSFAKCLRAADDMQLKSWCGTDSTTKVLVATLINVLEVLQKEAIEKMDLTGGKHWEKLLELFCDETCVRA